MCSTSSDWWANEKECKDSEGKRVRSSLKLNGGDEGPPEVNVREEGRLRVIEDDLEGIENDDSGEDGNVGVRAGGCCRIRRRPDTPKPCSCSGMIGDLAIASYSLDGPASNENRILVPSAAFGTPASRFPVLRFLGRDSVSVGDSDGEGDRLGLGIDRKSSEVHTHAQLSTSNATS